MPVGGAAREPLALGVVGGGQAASKAIRSFLHSSRAIQCVAVLCEAEELGNLLLPAQRVQSYANLLTNNAVTALYIATPNATHIPLADQALHAGKHVLVEKPLAQSMAAALDIQDHHLGNLCIGVAFKKRYGAGIGHLRRCLRQLGPPHEVSYSWHTSHPSTSWRYERDVSGGGVLMDLGSHVLDLFEHLFGRIASVQARITWSRHSTAIDEKAAVIVRFLSGLRGSIDLQWSGGNSMQSMTVACRTGTIQLQRLNRSEDILSWTGELPGSAVHAARSEYQGLFLDFARSIACPSGHRSVAGYLDGLRNLRLIEAAYQSAIEHKKVVVGDGGA